jgi:hypothetical protein
LPAAVVGGVNLRAVVAPVYVLGYGALLVVFWGHAIVNATTGWRLPARIEYGPPLYQAGLVGPNVFNRDDLTMGDRWPVVERLDGEHRGLVPFTGGDGERLEYHRGDLPYYACSLIWRRAMIGVTDLAAFHQPGAFGAALARSIAQYDYRRRGASGPGRYRVTLFQSHGSDFDRGPGPDRYRGVAVLEFRLQVGPPGDEAGPRE